MESRKNAIGRLNIKKYLMSFEAAKSVNFCEFPLICEGFRMIALNSKFRIKGGRVSIPCQLFIFIKTSRVML